MSYKIQFFFFVASIRREGTSVVLLPPAASSFIYHQSKLHFKKIQGDLWSNLQLFVLAALPGSTILPSPSSTPKDI